MYRNAYDTDVTTFSPAGRIHQVEYAMEAVKQGSAAVGIRSKTHAVIASVKRRTNELAWYQEKVFYVAENMGIAVSGLISDARVLRKYMMSECLNHKFVFNSDMQTERLVRQIADKSQIYTQKDEKRPYGVGLLVAGFDKTGAHLFQTDPSGNYYEYVAQAMGARSQSARTYLEKVFDGADDMKSDDLIHHALVALKATLPKDEHVNVKNVSIGIVGEGTPFQVLSEEEAAPHIDRVTGGEGGDPPAAAAAMDAEEEDEAEE